MQELCLQTVAANFATSPSLAYLPEAHVNKLISLLSLDLPLELAGTVRYHVTVACISMYSRGLITVALTAYCHRS